MGYICRCSLNDNILSHNKHITHLFTKATYDVVMPQHLNFQRIMATITHNHKTRENKMIFDREISIYSNVSDTKGSVGTLRDFLNIGQQCKDYIDRLRQASGDERKAMKLKLPCATISGIFDKRCKQGVIRHSGLIALDIDNVQDCSALIMRLADMDIIAYAGRSVGGNGVYAVVPIAYPEKHVQQWESLRRYFDSLGIAIDPATKDVSRLRICSYDSEARVRFDAVPYKGVYTPPQQKSAIAPRYYGNNETEARVSECCQQIAACHIDLTNGYADWLKIGFALSELGEAGRSYFHTVSSQCAKYDKEQCDRKYSECMRSVRSCGIGYFFNQCRFYGITYKNNRHE